MIDASVVGVNPSMFLVSLLFTLVMQPAKSDGCHWDYANTSVVDAFVARLVLSDEATIGFSFTKGKLSRNTKPSSLSISALRKIDMCLGLGSIL